jgi:hypothetical protein
MAVDLVIPVPDVDSIYGTDTNHYDTLRLYRAAQRRGPYSLVTSIALVRGDTVYPFVDPSGTTTSWYKVTFYNSVLTQETDLSLAEPFPATRGVTTRRQLREKIITNLGGFVFNSDSITTTYISAESIKSNLTDFSGAYVGWQVFRPDAGTASDIERVVSSYAPDLGQLSIHRQYSTTATTERIELLPVIIPFEKLNEKINDGLEDTRFLYRLEIGMTSGQLQYSLPVFVESPEYVHRMWRRMGPVNAYIWKPIDMNGRFARVRGSSFQCVLDVDPGFGENEVIALEVWRAGERLDSDNDFTLVPLPWAEAAAMVAVLEYLIDIDTLQNARPSLYERMHARWAVRLRKMSRRYGPTPGMVLQPLSRIHGLPDI